MGAVEPAPERTLPPGLHRSGWRLRCPPAEPSSCPPSLIAVRECERRWPPARA